MEYPFAHYDDIISVKTFITLMKCKFLGTFFHKINVVMQINQARHRFVGSLVYVDVYFS